MLKVKPEGREGVYIADKESLIDFLLNYESDVIHNQKQSGFMVLGADHDKDSVIDDVRNAKRLAILTDSAYRHNMKHALAVISDDGLSMFDIGEITANDLMIEE